MTLFNVVDKLRQLGPRLMSTIVATVDKLGTEFCLDVGPARYEAKLATKGARSSGQVVRHGNVAVVAASAARG